MIYERNKVHEELCLISQIETKISYEQCKDDHWIQEMKEELDWIVKNNTWELVPIHKKKCVIGAKWVFIYKMNYQGEVVRKKSTLVCNG